MRSEEFTQHIRFALQHLYEISVLDKGPAPALAEWLDQVERQGGEVSPGRRLHDVLVRAIQQMKPGDPIDANLPRHRSYLILKRRYVDGISIQQLEAEFNSSSRQFRRENHRAIEELVLALWHMAPAAVPAPVPVEASAAAQESLTGGSEGSFDFKRSVGTINLFDLVVDAAGTLSIIISNTRTQVVADVRPDLPPVAADRVALRLALIKLLRVAIAHSPGRVVTLRAEVGDDTLDLSVSGIADIAPGDAAFDEATQLFALADSTAVLQADPADAESAGEVPAQAPAQSQRCIVRLPVHHLPTILVIDDDPAMVRIIQRFTATQQVQVISCNSSDDVVAIARKAQPALILLDVLMPKKDGWEVLQELKATPDTYHLPLAVCSIWDERDLAMALGADLFFQKPIERAALLEVIAEIRLPGSRWFGRATDPAACARSGDRAGPA
jgi:CheY-like chemotaxis protein